jgi:hypothetical protein
MTATNCGRHAVAGCPLLRQARSKNPAKLIPGRLQVPTRREIHHCFGLNRHEDPDYLIPVLLDN